MTPKVSILMAAHNEEKYIAKAIQSILDQTFKNWELIIINDRSKDRTKEIANEFVKKDSRIKLISIKKNNAWKSGALNQGLKIVKGKYVCFLDGDDTYLKDKLEFQTKFMEKNKKIDMIYGKTKCFGEKTYVSKLLNFKAKSPLATMKRRSKEDLSKLEVGEFFGLKGSIPCCSVMIRKSILKGLKFEEKIPRSQDYDMWFQIIGANRRIKGINKIFYNYRRHKNQSITNKSAMSQSRDYILKKLKSGAYFKSLNPNP